MKSVDEALSLIAAQRRDFGTETPGLSECAGRILAEDIFADRDFPPYNRVTMDGIAISYGAWAQGVRTFLVEGLQPAGHPALTLSDRNACIEVMTGAALPSGTDVVIPYEACDISEGRAEVTAAEVRQLQNIHLQGTDAAAGAQLLSKNGRITPASVALMATVGKGRVLVRRYPRIAICATGDELVDICETPAPHQIRRSNSYMLSAALSAVGAASDSFHLPDNAQEMRGQLEQLVQTYDAILLSGAVSKGKYDFLPEVLTRLGMRTVFHRVAQRPGKPMLFGTFPQGAVVFGFPGNPVSTLVCYHLFFIPWLNGALGITSVPLSAQLGAAVDFRPALTYHLLSTLTMTDGIVTATPCPGANSGDMLSLQRADAIISLPAERQQFSKGEAFPLRLLVPLYS